MRRRFFVYMKIRVNGEEREITAGLNISGLLYAADALSYRAADPRRIDGLVVSLNLSNTAAARRCHSLRTDWRID